MIKILSAMLALTFIYAMKAPARAADASATDAIIDKAIKALGGEEKLGKLKIITWKSKNKITFNGMDNEGTGTTTIQGLDHFRQEFEGEFGGNKVKFVTILSGDKGSRKFGENATEMDKATVASQKRTTYMTVIPISMLSLKDKEFKKESIAEEKVGDKPAVGLKVTDADKKEFKIYFDKESGLPVKLVAKVPGFNGDEFDQETLFTDYKEIAGIKKSMKVTMKRNGEKFMEQTLTEFKILDKVDAKTFTDAAE